MERYSIISSLILWLLGFSWGQVTSPGRCPNLPTPQTFDVQSFLGPWFVVERFPEFSQIDTACPVSVFNLNMNFTIRIENTIYDIGNFSYGRSDHTATVINPLDPAKWLVQDPTQQYPYPYWVIDTDYRRFAVVWSCVDLFNGSHLQMIQILSRTRQGLPQYIRFLIYRYLQAFGIDTGYLQSPDQFICIQNEMSRQQAATQATAQAAASQAAFQAMQASATTGNQFGFGSAQQGFGMTPFGFGTFPNVQTGFGTTAQQGFGMTPQSFGFATTNQQAMGQQGFPMTQQGFGFGTDTSSQQATTQQGFVPGLQNFMPGQQGFTPGQQGFGQQGFTMPQLEFGATQQTQQTTQTTGQSSTSF